MAITTWFPFISRTFPFSVIRALFVSAYGWGRPSQAFNGEGFAVLGDFN
jgi:hypothetical protein